LKKLNEDKITYIKEDANNIVLHKKWTKIKNSLIRIVGVNWIDIFEKLEALAHEQRVSWELLTSLAASFNESVFYLAASTLVTLLIVQFILSLTGQGGMGMCKMKSLSGLKLRTPGSMMNLLLMPSLVRC
jgi:hypothetical protein